MAPEKKRPFDARAFLESAGLGKRVATYVPKEVVFSQGDPCDSVMYLQSGAIQLSVLSHTGKEAIVATLGPGDFLGEGALAGHPIRLETATATLASGVLVVPKRQMIDLLHSEHALSDRFIAHMLLRNARLEADLVDQLFNSSEKRLARTLLLLARYGKPDKPQRVLAPISQETLAEMVGTTRSRVNFFLNRFRKLGFIDQSFPPDRRRPRLKRSGAVPLGTARLVADDYSRGNDANLRSRMFGCVRGPVGPTRSGGSAAPRARAPVGRRAEPAGHAPSSDPHGVAAAPIPRDRRRGTGRGGAANLEASRALGRSGIAGLAPDGNRLTVGTWVPPVGAHQGEVMATMVMIVVLLMLLVSVPAWPHSRNWGYGPSGGMGLVLLVLVILLLSGRL